MSATAPDMHGCVSLAQVSLYCPLTCWKSTLTEYANMRRLWVTQFVMWPKSHGQHTETLTATVWFYVYVSLMAAAQLLTRRLCGAAGCLCSTSSADCQKKKKKSWQAGVDLAAVTQCGKLTLTQTPPAQRILQRLFLAGFYPQSCDCNVKPLTWKHRRTTLSPLPTNAAFTRNSWSCCEPRGRTSLR